MGLMMFKAPSLQEIYWLCFIYICAVFFFHFSAVPVLSDPDGYWHLEAGRYLLNSIAVIKEA